MKASGAKSLSDYLAKLTPSDREELLGSLSAEQLASLRYEWAGFWARPDQLPPDGHWRGFLLLGGRGSGKTRALCEWARSDLEPDDRVALVAATAADARDVLVEGPAGVLACSPPWNRPTYEPTKRRLVWPNGAQGFLYSADEPERLRGPQHSRAVADEIGSWRRPEAWDMLMLGLRLGSDPKWMAATTPRPTKLIRDLMALDGVVVSRSTTYDNRTNLAAAFLDEIIRKYEGTRLGRQELLGELLLDVPGALWSHDQLDALRVPEAPDLVRVVVGVDPAMTSGEQADHTGIVVAGKGRDGQLYVLGDMSCRKSPQGWAETVVNAFRGFKADRVVAEVNQGGDLVETMIRAVDQRVAYKGVHASRAKRVRAEPIAQLYEQGKVHHVGSFPALEDEMCLFTPDSAESPDRVDALVWALTELAEPARTVRFAAVGR